MVTEGSVKVKAVWSRYAYFQLILSSTVGNNFPVMNTACESKSGGDWPENVSLFFEEDESLIVFKGDSSSAFGVVPLELTNARLRFFRFIG